MAQGGAGPVRLRTPAAAGRIHAGRTARHMTAGQQAQPRMGEAASARVTRPLPTRRCAALRRRAQHRARAAWCESDRAASISALRPGHRHAGLSPRGRPCARCRRRQIERRGRRRTPARPTDVDLEPHAASARTKPNLSNQRQLQAVGRQPSARPGRATEGQGVSSVQHDAHAHACTARARGVARLYVHDRPADGSHRASGCRDAEEMDWRRALHEFGVSGPLRPRVGSVPAAAGACARRVAHGPTGRCCRPAGRCRRRAAAG